MSCQNPFPVQPGRHARINTLVVPWTTALMYMPVSNHATSFTRHTGRVTTTRHDTTAVPSAYTAV